MLPRIVRCFRHFRAVHPRNISRPAHSPCRPGICIPPGQAREYCPLCREPLPVCPQKERINQEWVIALFPCGQPPQRNGLLHPAHRPASAPSVNFTNCRTRSKHTCNRRPPRKPQEPRLAGAEYGRIASRPNPAADGYRVLPARYRQGPRPRLSLSFLHGMRPSPRPVARTRPII